jgi:small subunit ribosomal protein S18
MPSAPRTKPSGKANKFRKPRRKVCMFCLEGSEKKIKIASLDYKLMIQGKYRNKLISERGKIVPRRTTGTCAKHQRMVTEAVKRARHIALMPFVAE